MNSLFEGINKERQEMIEEVIKHLQDKPAKLFVFLEDLCCVERDFAFYRIGREDENYQHIKKKYNE